MRARSLAAGSPASGSSSPLAQRDWPAHDRLDRVDDVGGFGGECGALLDQIVGAGRARIERRAGDGEHLAALFGGDPRRDQRARAMRGFHHDDAERHARDQPVAPRKIPRARHMPERHLGNRSPSALDDLRQQVLMLRRIDPVMSAGQHRHGAARDAGAMRGLIDAAREPGGDDEAGFAEIARERACELQSGARGVARADDGDDRAHQRVAKAAHAEQWRRVVEFGQPRRIAVLARRNQVDAEPLARRKLGARILLAADPRGAHCTAAPRQLRQPLQRSARAAEMIDEGTEGARPRYYGANATRANRSEENVGLGYPVEGSDSIPLGSRIPSQAHRSRLRANRSPLGYRPSQARRLRQRLR